MDLTKKQGAVLAAIVAACEHASAATKRMVDDVPLDRVQLRFPDGDAPNTKKLRQRIDDLVAARLAEWRPDDRVTATEAGTVLAGVLARATLPKESSAAVVRERYSHMADILEADFQFRLNHVVANNWRVVSVGRYTKPQSPEEVLYWVLLERVGEPAS